MSLLWQLSKVGTPSKSANWDGGGRFLPSSSTVCFSTFTKLFSASHRCRCDRLAFWPETLWIGVMQFQSFQMFHCFAHCSLRPVPNVQAVQPLRSGQNVNRISKPG